jgi:hypothetical protein
MTKPPVLPFCFTAANKAFFGADKQNALVPSPSTLLLLNKGFLLLNRCLFLSRSCSFSLALALLNSDFGTHCVFGNSGLAQDGHGDLRSDDPSTTVATASIHIQPRRLMLPRQSTTIHSPLG